MQAPYMLGYRYLAGDGVPQDYVRAYAWLSISVVRHSEAGGYGAKITKDIVADRLTPAQMAEAQKLSSELWEKYVVPFQKN